MPRGRNRVHHIPAVELVDLYVKHQWDSYRLAKRYGCSQPTVLDRLREAGVLIRKGGNVRGKKLQARRIMPVDELVDLYVSQLWPSDRLAERYGCSQPTVLDRLRGAGVQIRHHNDTKRGAPSPRRHRIDEGAAVAAYISNPAASVTSVAREFKCHENAIRRALDARGIPLRSMSQIASLRTGAANANWRDDLTDEERANRRDMAAQAKWRELVYRRDSFACVRCGDAEGGNLNAHHVESHNSNRELRWSVENGVTFCECCHVAFHKKFGYGNNTAAQLRRYLTPERQAA